MIGFMIGLVETFEFDKYMSVFLNDESSRQC
jgi:hypothetical protein